MPGRRRWFGFLYALLGAQGSFFAWVLALLCVYVTSSEMWLWAFNPGPRDVSVAEILAHEPSSRRWVRTRGVEVDLALVYRSIGARGTAGPDRVLIDEADPTASAWRATLREIGTLEGALEAPPSDAGDAALKRLQAILPRLDAEGRARGFTPERALVVIARDDAGAPTAVAAAQPSAPGFEDAKASWLRGLKARVAAIHAAVRADADRDGLLARLPAQRRESYRDTYGVSVAGSALGVGHKPSTRAAAVFGISALTLAFLVLGLRSEVPPRDSGSAPAPSP